MTQSRPSTHQIAEIGSLIVQRKLLEAGFNVASPLVTDGTDLIAYDHGRCWQIQVKTTNRNKIDLRWSSSSRRTDRFTDRYLYIDVFALVSPDNEQFGFIPAELLDRQRTIRTAQFPAISADVLRHQPITCGKDLHSWPRCCRECTRRHALLCESDREKIAAFLGRRRHSSLRQVA